MTENESVVESSTAAVEPIPFEQFSSEQRAAFFKDGSLPEPPKKEAPAPSPDSEKESKAAPVKAEEKPAPEPGKAEPAKRKGAEERKAELAGEIQDLLKQRAKLRGEVEQLGKGEKVAAPPAEEGKKEPTKAAKPKPVLADHNGDYEAWIEALTEWKADQKLETYRTETAKATEQAKVTEQNKTIEQNWKTRVETATKKHGDFIEIALNDDLVKKIPQGSLIDALILHRESGPEILYYFGQNPAELERVLKLHVFDQAFEIAKIEAGFAEPPKTEPKKVTAAPSPPKEVGGKGTAPEDEIGVAVGSKDFSTFRKAANARDKR